MIALHVYMESRQNNTAICTVTTAAGTNTSSVVAVISYRAHQGDSEVNSTLDCHIDSLEVYRGRVNVMETSHDEFSITGI